MSKYQRAKQDITILTLLLAICSLLFCLPPYCPFPRFYCKIIPMNATSAKTAKNEQTPSLKLPSAILSTSRQQATGNRQQATGNRQQAIIHLF
jgi:hypothetical protein